ncbi:MAG TPA: TlpA family protein disulfide reductase [Cytophagales bacterium]|nr:TlpA family protein disulfide reductase [Cytophagales bacterium]HAA23845.1 TlpA family protein disulfide reductase [Cytophagales bacterium]HAP58408.1 TlpA family protein disulfide reductase [Cytophagales bacterium]
MMRNLVFLLLFGLFSYSANAQVTVVKWSELEAYLAEDSDKVRVVNFWATWCAPCVKELPYFQAAHEKWGSQDIEVVLVSLDDVEIVEKRVAPFVDRKGLTAKVFLLDETDYNMFIPKVDDRWSGAIPMTLILDGNSDKRIFLEKELTQEELFTQIENIID